MRKPRVCFRDEGEAFVGEIEMPTVGGGRVLASAVGFNPFDTLSRVATMAERIATDPALAPIIPPQALLAAKTARAIANTGRQSPDLLRQLTPDFTPASRTLSRALQAAAKKRKRRRRSGRSSSSSRRRERGVETYGSAARSSSRTPQYDAPAPGYEQQPYEQQPYEQAMPSPQPGYYAPAQTPGAFMPSADDLRARELWGEGAFAPGSFGGTATPAPQGFDWTQYEEAPDDGGGYVDVDDSGGEYNGEE